ncbi:hypothetical protein MMC11_002436 [Xylographa trunciseda]|nr:hypothetical protein [Xylographa trunciseda]
MPSLAVRKGWLPREGFTADVVQSIIQNTVLNPVLTLPLVLLARYVRDGEYTIAHPLAVNRLQICLYLGIARWVNGFLSRGSLNNWTSDRWDWDKELIVITGGSDGIGKLLVQLFAGLNAKILILDVQKPTFEMPNSRVHYLSCDVSSPTAIASAASTIRSTHGDPTILINNAGIANRRPLISLPDALLTRVYNINTLSHFRLVREFLPAIAAANHGAVVTVASLAGFISPPGLVDYASTKASAIAFHKGLTAELKNRYAAPRVRTICVCPSFTRTKLSEGFQNGNWLNPLLEVETVAEAAFERVVKGQSGFVVLPKTAGFFAMTVVNWPSWMQGLLLGSVKETMRGAEKTEERKDSEAKKARPSVEKAAEVEKGMEDQKSKA